MQEVISFLRENGINQQLELNGKVHRFPADERDKKKSLWAIGYQNMSNTGQAFYVVRIGDFKTGTVKQYTSTDGLSLDKHDRDKIKKQLNEAQKKAEVERSELQEFVAKESQLEFESYWQDGLSEYHAKKKLTSMCGARLDNEAAIVPMRDVDGKLWGYQRIFPDGKKFYKKGQRKDATFHIIGELDKSKTVLICEGFATGATLFEVTGMAVICAFDSGNLPKVAAAVKKKWQSFAYVVAGDNDLWTMKQDMTPWNPGLEKASEAAKKIMASVVVPQFKDLSTKPTDFNDLFILEGADAVKAQVCSVKAERSGVASLGFSEGNYFFTSTSNPTISVLSAFSETELLKLMPALYWQTTYPNDNDGIEWLQVKSDLMEQARKSGMFEGQRVRGAGAWMDEGRLVLNLGNQLLVGDRVMGVNEIESRHFYTYGKAIPEVLYKPLALEDCDLLVKICDKFKWRQPEYGRYVAGMLIISKICGALPIRPHMWITGGSQTGKSTLLERLVFPTLADHSLYFQGGTSEAGVRQALKSDSLPIIFDEFETNGRKSAEHIQQCVELMRSAWSETRGFIVKGSGNGTAVYYQPRFSAIVSSIRTNLVNDADRSRFTVVELRPHGGDMVHWKELGDLLAKYDQVYIDRLFARTLKMLPIILQNFEALRRALAGKGSARFADQHGMLLAGYGILMSDEALVESDIKIMVDNVGLEDERAESHITDDAECYDFILNKRTKHTSVNGQHSEPSVGELVDTCQNSPVHCDAEKKTLKYLGLSVESGYLIVANSHPELRALFNQGGEKWANSWSRTLSRLPGALKGDKPMKFGASTARYVKIPIRG